MGSRSLLAILSTRPFGGFFFGVIMLKKFYLALAIFAGLFSPAHSAGTIPWSLSQQQDALGKPLAGCKLYIYAAGTTTPQNAYQDTALTNAWPNPLTCDSAGRLPQFFLADGLVKIRITDKNGVTQAYAGQGQIDNILVIGPSSGGGGGGGGSVDPTTVLATGDIKLRYGTGVLAGFVRQNGRTIGSSTSGATERANADCQSLFEYLWAADPNLTVSTGRGASANADWVANKTIALPDNRGRVPAGLDDMGNTAAGKFSGVSFSSGNATTLGSVLGIVTQTIPLSGLPNYAPTFIGNLISGLQATTNSGTSLLVDTGITETGSAGGAGRRAQTGNGTSTVANFTPSGTVGSINGGVTQTALPTIQPTFLVTIYQKL